MQIDVNWCIRNRDGAIDHFNKRQIENSKLVKDFNLRENNIELEDVHREIKDLIDQFSQYYNDAVVANSDLEEIDDMIKKGGILEERHDLQKSKIKIRLVDSFQKLIDLETGIIEKSKSIVDLADIKRQVKSAEELKEIKKPCEEELQRIREELQKALKIIKYRDIQRSQLDDQMEKIIAELPDEILDKIRIKGSSIK